MNEALGCRIHVISLHFRHGSECYDGPIFPTLFPKSYYVDIETSIKDWSGKDYAIKVAFPKDTVL